MSDLTLESFAARDTLWFDEFVSSVGTIDAFALDSGYAYNFGADAGVGRTALRYLASTKADIGVRSFFYFSVIPASVKTLIGFRSGATIIGVLAINASRKLQVFRGDQANSLGTGSTTLLDATGYHIEIRYSISDTVGIVTVWLNGILETGLNLTNQDTKPGSETTMDRIAFSGNGNTSYMDSVCIYDGADGQHGVVRTKVVPMTANSSYANAWSKSSGSSGFPLVVVPQDGDASYVAGITNTSQQAFVPDSHGLVSPNVIRSRNGRHVVRKVSSGQVIPFYYMMDAFFAVLTPYYGASVPLGVSYKPILDMRRISPGTGNAWLLTETTEVGLRADL